ncbi:MAG: pyridoxal phosphate-dependent aminotransferase family protein [Bacteroidales bacterium]|nr:pyridoxal phosphate-dependent aminotransferase family protein [Bacteroidales bacterium]
MDIFDKINQDLGSLGRYSEEAHGYYIFPELEGPISNRMKFQGKEKIVWSVNNYLGLANHPDVRKADAEAARDWGMAYPMGARAMSGQTKYHEQLENELAQFVDKKAAYLLNYGYQGIVSIIDALVDRKDVIVYDSEAHACILDGMRLHIGKRFVYPHNDMEKLEKQLQRATKITKETGGGILLITEGVFGMAGDLGHLDKITAFKETYDFRILVDDAHGFGTMGEKGSGTGEHYGVQDKIDLYFGTFAKAMAGIGAFIASNDQKVITYLMYNMRSQIFAKSLPMPMVLGALKRLDMIRTQPEHKQKLWDNTKKLQSGLRKNGFDIGVTESCVTPVFLKGTLAEATHITYDLREKFNIFTSIVVYPVVPKGVIMLRLIPTADHNDEDIELTIDAFSKVKEKLTNQEYPKEEFAKFST